MSYNQKPPGSSGSGMGGGPPNGPNNMPQVAKTFAGIQQQMQNLVHGQNAIPQSSQADINAFLQQQRIQNMLKQQQQFLQFQHQMQQQQHQQQQHQHHNMTAGGGVVGPGPVNSVPGVGGPNSGSTGGSGEPLALTRTAGAAELLNKTYQQQANGNPAATPTFNQLQQTLQALPTNFVQQLQVFQYQMQAKQMQQQQHASAPGQHGHVQNQPVQGVPPLPPTTTVMSHQQQQQQQQQKHQNQHQQTQQQNALSRYLTAAAQAAAVSGNKISSVTPPPLTNQMKPPNLPPNTQITPVTASIVSGGNISAGPHPKMSTGNANAGPAKHSAPAPSISLTPTKAAATGPSIAHQQNKFTPPTNSGTKGAHITHSQNLAKSTHGASHTAASNVTSPAKTGPNADAIVAALKSPQSTPVQLTKQMPSMATTASISSKTLANATTTTIGATSTMVSPIKSNTTTTTALIPIAANIQSATTVDESNNSTISTTTAVSNVTSTKPLTVTASKPVSDELAVSKCPVKSAKAEKEIVKTPLSEINNPSTESRAISNVDGTKKETEKPKEVKETKLELGKVVNKAAALPVDVNDVSEKTNNDLISKSSPTATTSTATTLLDSKEEEVKEKSEPSVKSNKTENHDANESHDKISEPIKNTEKDKATDENTKAPAISSAQETAKHLDTPSTSGDKKVITDLNQTKNSLEENKLDEKLLEKENEKTFKPNKLLIKNIQVEEKGVLSQDIQKSVPEAKKSIITVETKTSPTPTPPPSPPPPTSEIISDTKSEKESNVKNSNEINNKICTTESKDQNKKEEHFSINASVDAESAKATKSNQNVLMEKQDPVVKEKESTLKALKSTENKEINTSIKPTQVESNKIHNTEDKIKDTTVNEVQKEKVTAEVTPIKKLGRLAKAAAKSKSVTSTIPVESKTAGLEEDKPAASSARVKRKSKVDNSTAVDMAPSTPRNDDSDRKSKRHRLKTILYQSPLPELAYITKLSASEASNSPKPMSNEDRLIVFYKNEYMAVRNAEGTFYLCQTMQNVYRTSPRISIRWLSEDAKDCNVFIPDFYDHTDIECVLTTVELKRIDKGHLRLPKGERNRIESILKKAIDVEKGLVPRPELTEENPDGLDISLFKDESQIEKKSALTDGSENQTPSVTASRKSRRGNIISASSVRKSSIASTPSTSVGNKRKRNASSVAAPSSSSRKQLNKKRKTLVKRKKKIDNSDDDDDNDDETTDNYESDAEYKPTQKRASLDVSSASKSTPRAQRSPLAKARAASPITPTTSRSKTVPQKITTTPTPSTSKASRGERAAKRKSIIDAGSSEEVLLPIKKTMATTNNKSKASDKHTSEANPIKNISRFDNISGS